MHNGMSVDLIQGSAYQGEGLFQKSTLKRSRPSVPQGTNLYYVDFLLVH